MMPTADSTCAVVRGEYLDRSDHRWVLCGHTPGEPGETYDLPIEDYGSTGDGIGYGDGFAIVVPNTSLGARD